MILIDALGGADQVTVGPTVQRTVWVDAGDGDDRVEIRSGSTILPDVTERPRRNDEPQDAFPLWGAAIVQATQAAPEDGILTADATFRLQIGTGSWVTVAVPAAATDGSFEGTSANESVAELVADINESLAIEGIDGEVVAQQIPDPAGGARIAFVTRRLAPRPRWP